MDQSKRIIIQAKTIEFPSIGFWITKKSSTKTDLIQKLVKYCKMKMEKKCKFVYQGKKYFYLSFCSNQTKTPQLFLVQWNQIKENIINLEFKLEDVEQKKEIVLRSDQHSHLEFTLRSDQKIPEKLQNIECSPILLHEKSDSKSIHQESSHSKNILLETSNLMTMNIFEPDSPRFKNVNPSHLQLECSTLRRLVQIQQRQIDQLKAQLRRVNLSHFKQSNPQILKQKQILLTEKDLSTGSSLEHPSTNSSSNSMNEDMIPWEKFKFIDNQ